MEEKIYAVLEKIGLSKNEIKIYLDLLKFKNSNATDISKRIGIHRSNTYDTLRKLIEMGFIFETIEENNRLFSSADPEIIKDYLKQKEEEFDELIPYLKGISSEKGENEGVLIKKGVLSVRGALHDLLKLNKTINVYGASTNAVNTLGEGFLKEFHAERIKKHTLMRHIYDEDSVERVKHLNKLNLTEAKYFPKKYNTVAATVLCDNVTLIIIFSSPISAIVIRNREISEAYNRYFEFLWRGAKVPH